MLRARSILKFNGFLGLLIPSVLCLLQLNLAAQTKLPQLSVVLKPSQPAFPLPQGYDQYAKSGRFWQAQMVLAGKSWWIAALEPPNGSRSSFEQDIWMLFLQDASRGPASPPRDPWMVSPSQNLFLDSHAYEVASAFEKTNKSRQLRVTLKEKTIPLGSLRVEGNQITRLQLYGQYLVCLDAPKPVERIPVGTYHYIAANVGPSNLPTLFAANINSQIQVTASNTAVVAAHGPLTNSVTATLRGRTLRLDYQLTDAEGHSYRITDTSKPPRFTVTLNNERVHSGDFEFG
jgi:hypothetical protein